jgi:multicomponent Na+:H+ antiporter subunit C
MEDILAKYNYWIYVLLMMIGLYAMIAKNNLFKKVIGMSIFQTAIIIFYVSIAAKEGGTIPIILGAHGPGPAHAIDPAAYVNPLPHVLMLTAIVVGVSTLGVALAVILSIYRQYGTTEEDQILEKLQ